MLKRLGWLLAKDLLESLRSHTALVVLFSPLLLALLLQTLTGKDLKPVRIGVVAARDSGLVRNLSRNPALLVDSLASLEEAQLQLRQQRLTLVVQVDPDFDTQLLAGQRPLVRVWGDRGHPTQVALAREALRGSLRDQMGQSLPARIESQTMAGKEARDFFLASSVLLASMSAMVIAAANLVEEKEAGTLQLILLSPASPTELWIGKLAVSTALGTLAAMLVVALCGPSLSSFGAALGLTLVASFVFAALGGIIGLLANGPASASSWTGLCFIALFAPASLSETSQALSRWAKVSPAFYLYDGLQRTMLAQEPASSQVYNLGILFVFGVTLTLVGGRLLRRYR